MHDSRIPGIRVPGNHIISYHIICIHTAVVVCAETTKANGGVGLFIKLFSLLPGIQKSCLPVDSSFFLPFDSKNFFVIKSSIWHVCIKFQISNFIGKNYKYLIRVRRGVEFVCAEKTWQVFVLIYVYTCALRTGGRKSQLLNKHPWYQVRILNTTTAAHIIPTIRQRQRWIEHDSQQHFALRPCCDNSSFRFKIKKHTAVLRDQEFRRNSSCCMMSVILRSLVLYLEPRAGVYGCCGHKCVAGTSTWYLVHHKTWNPKHKNQVDVPTPIQLICHEKKKATRSLYIIEFTGILEN